MGEDSHPEYVPGVSDGHIDVYYFQQVGHSVKLTWGECELEKAGLRLLAGEVWLSHLIPAVATNLSIQETYRVTRDNRCNTLQLRNSLLES